MDRQTTTAPGEMYALKGCQHRLKETVAAQTYELPVSTKITANSIENIVIDALECTSTYWVGVDNTTPEWASKPKELPVSQFATALLLSGKSVKLYDIEDNTEEWELTLEKLLEGIGKAMLDGRTIEDIEDDADTALQYALFGEIVYG